jgi:IclR family KDG regulon transcriptional repressor
MKILKRAFKILDLFLNDEDELTLKEIVALSGLNPATARRITLTLIECNYLRKSSRRGKYSPGWKFLGFSRIIKLNNNIIRIATPHLNELRQQVNETVSLAIWDGRNTSICQSFISGHNLKVIPHEGERIAMHAMSIGKAILAELPEEELQKYFSNNLERYTQNTITDFNDLKKHLIIIRHECVAFDDEECVLGVRGVGAAVKSKEETILGAIGIIGPSVRLTREKIKEYAPVIKNCALEISRELGYKGL